MKKEKEIFVKLWMKRKLFNSKRRQPTLLQLNILTKTMVLPPTMVHPFWKSSNREF